MERINNGDVALHGYQHQVTHAYQARQLKKCRGYRNGRVVVTWVVEHVHTNHERRVPEHESTGDEVGRQHAGKDEVGLGPESGRQSDGDQRKPIAADIK